MFTKIGGRGKKWRVINDIGSKIDNYGEKSCNLCCFLGPHIF